MFKIFHREKKKPAIEKAQRKECHPGCIRPSTKKKKTTDFQNYICLFKKHTKGLVIEG